MTVQSTPAMTTFQPQAGTVRRSETATRVRLAAASLVVAGVLFVLYPAIRPFSSEKGLAGAAAFGSSHWILAHMLAMVGFALLAFGVLGLYLALRRGRAETFAFWSLVVTLLGITLTLPFYGGEAYGLHAIGQRALQEHNGSLTSLQSTVRGGPGLILFLTGLLLLGVGAIMESIAIGKSGIMAKWSGSLFALGFALYIPQFFGTQPLRVVHGLLILVGCAWIAVSMWRASDALADDA